MWLRQVARVMDSSASIWVLDRPRAMRVRTSRWRGVSSPTRLLARGWEAAPVPLGHEPGQHQGAEQGLPGVDGAHAVHQALGVGVLEQEPGGARAQCPHDVVVHLEHGQDEHARGGQGRVAADARRGLDAGEDGHLDVHDDDVGAQLGAAGHRLGAVVHGRHDAHVGLRLQQR